MPALAHVVLQVGFCGAIARASSNATVAVRVRLTDRIGRTEVDRTYRVERDDDDKAVVEFDSPFGVHKITVVAPQYRCSATDYLFFFVLIDRSTTEKLNDAP